MALALPDAEVLASRILGGERSAVAAGLNLLDNTHPQARERSAELLSELARLTRARGGQESHLIGITGPPGSGKSSLVAALIREWRHIGRTVAVLAVDPSSRPQAGGGALLGDRIRIKNVGSDEGVFIRSLASRNQLGGVATEVWPMARLLMTYFDLVVVETVGVGQTEIDIAEIADTVCYVAQPASGDTIQYIKSGIMEIPDIFAVNKADLGAAAQKTATEISRGGEQRPDRQSEWDYPVALVSAGLNTGIAELVEHIDRHRVFLTDSDQLAARRRNHQGGWIVRLIQDEFGTFGMGLAGGRGALEERLHTAAMDQLHEYAQLRRLILSRFTH